MSYIRGLQSDLSLCLLVKLDKLNAQQEYGRK